MVQSIGSSLDFSERMLPVYYFEGDVPGNDPNFTTYMYDPLPLYAAPKQLSRAFMVNTLYFDGVSAEVGGVRDPCPAVALPSEEDDVSTCYSIEFLEKARMPVARGDPDLVEELGEDVTSRIVLHRLGKKNDVVSKQEACKFVSITKLQAVQSLFGSEHLLGD